MKHKNGVRLSLGLILALMLIFGFAGITPAAESTKADEWKFHTIVDLKFIKQYTVMPQPKNVLIVDVRPKQPKFDNGFIPTAINIPLSKFDEMTEQLPKDKNDLLIFYCEGPT